MALSCSGRIPKLLSINSKSRLYLSQVNYSSGSRSNARRNILLAAGVLGVGGAGLVFALDQSVHATSVELHPPKLPWYHKHPFHSYDHASIRRGFEVYKQVCSACHSIEYLRYGNLVGISHTLEEAKAEAAEQMILDGPNVEGEMFDRPGELSDYLKRPYLNDEAAKHANNGALPPDLSFITYARHGGEDYIFSILTSYCDPPAGVTLGEGQYYNPYFAGGAISMAQALYNEIIEYEDGTPATQSQLAKDVITFLTWVTSPEHDERKRLLIKVILISVFVLPAMYYLVRRTWAPLKSRKIFYQPVNHPTKKKT